MHFNLMRRFALSFAASTFLVILPSHELLASGILVHVEFSGTVTTRFPIGSHGPGTFGEGSFYYDATAPDTDPNPNFGTYFVNIVDFDLQGGGESLSFSSAPAVFDVGNDIGCDCFSIVIPQMQSIGGVEFDSILLAVSDEPQTMFEDDSLLRSTPMFPPGTSMQLNFYQANVAVGILRIDSLALTAVPEPAAASLVAVGLLCVVHVRPRRHWAA